MRALSLQILFCSIAGVPTAYAQSVMDANPGGASDLKLGVLLGYNFNGNQSWANLQPEVFAGIDETLARKWRVRIGPSFSSGGNASDSSSFFRSLMLPGKANITAQVYVDSSPEASRRFSAYGGVGFGLKAVSSNADSVNTVAQFNIRLAGGLRFKKLIVLAAQYTIGWHNIVNESEATFKSVFGVDHTRIQYLMISMQSYVPKADVYLDVTWRGVTNGDSFTGFRDKTRVVGIGIRKEVQLLNTPVSSAANFEH